MSETAIASLVKSIPWLAGAFVFCFFAEGWIWWRGTYQEYLQSGLPWEAIVLLAGAAFVLPSVCGAGIIPSAITIGCVFPAVIAVRVVLDGLQNPTDHNLWPFEVVFASVIGMGIAFPAAVIGWLLRRIVSRQTDHAPKTHD
jgi:hypothetical protein